MDTSPADVVRQIEREGAHWGLVPTVKNDIVFVAEKVAALQSCGTFCCLVDEHQPICSLDAPDAFDAVLKNLKRMGDWDALRKSEERDARMRKIDEQKYEAVSHQYSADGKKLVAKYGWQDFLTNYMRAARERGRPWPASP